MKTLALIFVLAMASAPAGHDTPARPRPINERLVETFRGYIGIKEQPLGSNNGPMVDKFNASCGLDPKEHAPWCAAVANYGYELNGLPGHGAYSPSWYSKRRVVDRDHARPGDLGLIWFPSKGRYAHTIAAIESVRMRGSRAIEYVTLEGNTNAQGSREGDQFARRIRAADTVTVVRWCSDP